MIRNALREGTLYVHMSYVIHLYPKMKPCSDFDEKTRSKFIGRVHKNQKHGRVYAKMQPELIRCAHHVITQVDVRVRATVQ